jgi:methionyl-tRNA formyltransferase
LAGDTSTGVSIMRLESGVDTGPVYAQRAIEIDQMERTPDLHDRLAQLGAELLAETLERISSGGPGPEEQPSEGVLHAPLLSKDEGSVRFDMRAMDVHNRVRALQPWPGVTVLHGERRVKLLGGRPIELQMEEDALPGQLLRVDAQGLAIACDGDAYLCEELQPEARGAMAAADYARGAGLSVGDILRPLDGFLEKTP